MSGQPASEELAARIEPVLQRSKRETDAATTRQRLARSPAAAVYADLFGDGLELSRSLASAGAVDAKRRAGEGGPTKRNENVLAEHSSDEDEDPQVVLQNAQYFVSQLKVARVSASCSNLLVACASTVLEARGYRV